MDAEQKRLYWIGTKEKPGPLRQLMAALAENYNRPISQLTIETYSRNLIEHKLEALDWAARDMMKHRKGFFPDAAEWSEWANKYVPDRPALKAAEPEHNPSFVKDLMELSRKRFHAGMSQEKFEEEMMALRTRYGVIKEGERHEVKRNVPQDEAGDPKLAPGAGGETRSTARPGLTSHNRPRGSDRLPYKEG